MKLQLRPLKFNFGFGCGQLFYFGRFIVCIAGFREIKFVVFETKPNN